MYEMLRKIYFWSNRVFCLSLCIICILCPGTRFTYNCIAFFINDQLRTKWLKNIVKGLNMNVLKNTDDDRGFIKLKFQCPIYIRTATFLFYYCICQKQKPKMGVVFVVDGGGDAGECWHQRQPTGPHWADPAMFGFVKQCWMYVLLRSYMSACFVSLSVRLSVCLCLLFCLQ